MRAFPLPAMILLAACSSTPPAEKVWPRGQLMIVGGGRIPEEAVRCALEAAGGGEARVLIIPSASGTPGESAASAREMFSQAGARDLDVLEAPDPSPEAIEKVRAATLLFFDGGDQNRLTAALLNTPLLEEMKRRYEEGAVVMGTSAGAAILGDVMMTGQGDFDKIAPGAPETAPGLGFLPGTLVDQHFAKRHRHNRLMSAVLYGPPLIGIGIDEATALWVIRDRFAVLGDSTVEVYYNREIGSHRSVRLLVLTRGMTWKWSRG